MIFDALAMRRLGDSLQAALIDGCVAAREFVDIYGGDLSYQLNDLQEDNYVAVHARLNSPMLDLSETPSIGPRFVFDPARVSLVSNHYHRQAQRLATLDALGTTLVLTDRTRPRLTPAWRRRIEDHRSRVSNIANWYTTAAGGTVRRGSPAYSLAIFG